MALMALCQSARLAVSIGFIMRVAAAGVPDSQALLAQALLFMRRSSLYFAIALRFLYAWSRERCSCLPSCPAVLLAAQVFWGGGRGLACCPHEHTKACPLAYSHPLSCPAPSPRSPAFILYAILGVCVCGWVCVGGGGGGGGGGVVGGAGECHGARMWGHKAAFKCSGPPHVLMCCVKLQLRCCGRGFLLPACLLACLHSCLPFSPSSSPVCPPARPPAGPTALLIGTVLVLVAMLLFDVAPASHVGIVGEHSVLQQLSPTGAAAAAAADGCLGDGLQK